MLTLKIQQMAINGTPYRCPECASEAFTLDGAGFIDAFPVRGNCWQSHSWEEPLITIGGLKQIRSASTGRAKATDEDTFRITVGGARLEGTIAPEVTADDLKVAGTAFWRRGLKPTLRRRKRAAVRAIKRPVARAASRAVSAVTSPVTDTVAAAQAAALGAAWDWQSPGGDPNPDYTPDPITACTACDGKGSFSIDSRVHELATARCSVCLGTGQID